MNTPSIIQQARARSHQEIIEVVLSLVVVCTLVSGMVFAVYRSISHRFAHETAHEELFRVAIERYFRAVLAADTDTVLDALDPDSPLYPGPDAVASLRLQDKVGAVKGKADVLSISILEETETAARVQLTMFMRADVRGNGTYAEETSKSICELRRRDGKWRLFNARQIE